MVPANTTPNNSILPRRINLFRGLSIWPVSFPLAALVKLRCFRLVALVFVAMSTVPQTRPDAAAGVNVRPGSGDSDAQLEENREPSLRSQHLSAAFASLLTPSARSLAESASTARTSQEALVHAVDAMAAQLARVDAACARIDGVTCAQQAGRLDSVRRRVKAMAGRVEGVVTRLDRLLLAVSKLPPSALSRAVGHGDGVGDDDDDEGEEGSESGEDDGARRLLPVM